MKFLLFFIALNVINVILQTVKSIATVKCKALPAALVNAIAFGLYTVVVVYTTTDALDLFGKVVVTALTNLIGVYVVKKIEEKNRKDKLWEVKATVKDKEVMGIHNELEALNIPHNWFITSGEYRIFNIYCATQTESQMVRDILNNHCAKYFVSESKTL
jgi:uncharacterized protein YebE (UPF0316 family)